MGKINYSLQALIDKGLVIAKTFGKSENKRRYQYILTTAGLENKASLSKSFLKYPLAEYESLIEENQKKLKDTERADT